MFSLRPIFPAAWISGLFLFFFSGMVLLLAGIPFKIINLFWVILIICIILFLIKNLFLAQKRVNQNEEVSRLSSGALFSVILLSLLFLNRSFFQPLAGADTAFRWELLARQLLHYENLNFYPPFTQNDFRIYFYPDGMSPLVAFTHWACYLWKGSPDLSATFGPVLFTFIVIISLTIRAAFFLGGVSAANGAAYALVGTPLLFWATIQGQETGLTCLGVISGAYYLIIREKTPGQEVIAGMALSLTMLAREYGFLLVSAVLLGAMLSRQKVKWGYVLLPILTIGSSWYFRNLILLGNPFYPLAVAGIFPPDPVHAGLLEACRTTCGWERIGWRGGIKAYGHLIQLAFLPIVSGGFILFFHARRWLWLIPIIIFGVWIWLWSVNYTSGGLPYSYRVLSPLLPFGCLLSGLCFSYFGEQKGLLKMLTILWPIVSFYGLLNSLTMPSMVKSIDPRNWLSTAFQPKSPYPEIHAWSLHEKKVLTENPYLHAAMLHFKSAGEIIPVWSPEVAFLFEKELTFEERERRIRKIGITRITEIKESSPWRPFYQNQPFFIYAFKKYEKDKYGNFMVPDGE